MRLEQFIKDNSREFPQETPKRRVEDFVSRYRHERKMHRLRLACAGFAGATASFVLAMVLWWSPGEGDVSIKTYEEAYVASVLPLYEQSLQLESESEICAQMEMSKQIGEIISQMREFSSELESEHWGADDVYKDYCRSEIDAINTLYRACQRAYYENQN